MPTEHRENRLNSKHALRQSDSPELIEPYPLLCLIGGGENDALAMDSLVE